MNNEAWFNNSLKAAAREMRARANRNRKAYTTPFMGEPTKELARIYDECAQLLEDEIIRRPSEGTGQNVDGGKAI